MLCVVCHIDCYRSSHGIDHRANVLTLFQGLMLRTGHRYVRTYIQAVYVIELIGTMFRVKLRNAFLLLPFVLYVHV